MTIGHSGCIITVRKREFAAICVRLLGTAAALCPEEDRVHRAVHLFAHVCRRRQVDWQASDAAEDLGEKVLYDSSKASVFTVKSETMSVE